MLRKFALEMRQLITAMQASMLFALQLVGILLLIHIINSMSQYRLNTLGIRPRTLKGLPGIIFAPLLHGNFNHLFFNTIPLFVLSDLILPEGKIIFCYVSGTIILLSGFLIWLFGRRGIHIGASSLIMGYFGYLLSGAFLHITATTIVLAGFCLYYFGGLFLSLFPGAKKNVSWDGHIYGFLSGIFTAFYLPKILWFVGF
ncbi:MAG: rhomboid family transporter protein [uncultured bacterium]|nr:MAG: rhomboid family transporter protein [uncultured bacterium]